MISEIAYHDYVLLLCSFDAEWSRQKLDRGDDAWTPFRRVFEQFTTTCWQYGQDVRDNHQAFSKAKGVAAGQPLSRFLFNPLSYFPFCHADATVVALVDDFDPVHHLTASAPSTIEDVSLGFCPRLESLGLDAGDGIFAELHALFGEEPEVPAALEEQEKAEKARYRPVAQDFQARAPLLLFSKYKMDGLAAVGQGLLFQQALFRAMASEIRTVLTLLRAQARDPQSTTAQLMSEEDIQATRCVFLDLQGSAEIGTLVFCRNYSVAVTLLAHLRALTFGAVFDGEIDRQGTLKALVNRSDMHRQVIDHARELAGDAASGPEALSQNADLLSDNHVFRWTQSLAAVAWESFVRGDQRAFGGYVEAVSEFQLASGHCASAERKVKATVAADPGTGPPRVAPGSYYRYVIGTGDLVVRHGWESTSGTEEGGLGARARDLIPVGAAIDLVRENFRRFSQRPGDMSGRDAPDFTTTLIVPVPKVLVEKDGVWKDAIVPEIGKNHFAPLGMTLREAQRRLCKPNLLPPGERLARGPRSGRLDLHKLRTEPRRYGVPVSLRRTIEYLYNDFATLIADPFLFDVVLDLYDSFATLHAVLTDHLPQLLLPTDSKSECPPRWRVLEDGRVNQLSMLVDAMNNSLQHRLAGTYPETRLRDTAIDFRGGLNQILFAADVPMKCGLGLLRKCVPPRTEKSRGRETVGALLRIQFEPGALCQVLTLGTEQHARLGFLSGDVPHVLHVANYGNHLHEAFHLIFDEICEPPGSTLSPEDVKKVVHHRLSEVFAVFCSQLFLCGRDVRMFRRLFAISFVQSVSSVGVDDRETVMRLTEFLIRLFLATDMVAAVSGDPIDWPLEYAEREGDHLGAAQKRFWEMFDALRPVFSEYEPFCGDLPAENVQRYLDDRFLDIYDYTRHFLPEIWREGVAIYRRFVRRTLPSTSLAGETAAVGGAGAAGEDQLTDEDIRLYRKMQVDVRGAVTQCLKEGKALIRGACPDGYRSGEDFALDPLLLVSTILREYLGGFDVPPDKSLHLYRDPYAGNLSFEGKSDWHEFLIDKGAAGLFCPVPEARRERLRKQISVLKTFWDISSGLRARRLLEIIRDNWPDAAPNAG